MPGYRVDWLFEDEIHYGELHKGMSFLSVNLQDPPYCVCGTN